MRKGRRFRKWVVAAVLGSTLPGFAQSPAARLVPIDPNQSPTVPVARSAYPEIPNTEINQVPAQGYSGQMRQAGAVVPDPNQPNPAALPQPDRPKSWVGGAWNGMRDIVTGKPVAAPGQVAQQPVPQGARPNVPNQPAVQTPPQPGVYAGPPAYRWYGWGSTTPGSNQYAPLGLYPKGSANWYAHTGATPGAFPVPVQYPQMTPGVEPPVYAANPQVYDAAYAAPTVQRPEPAVSYEQQQYQAQQYQAQQYQPQPPQVPQPVLPPSEPSRPSRSGIQGPPSSSFEMPSYVPVMPQGAPRTVTQKPLATPSTAATPTAIVVEPSRSSELDWRSAPNIPPAPTIPTLSPTSAPTPAPLPTTPPAGTSPVELHWSPASSTTYPGTTVSAAPIARGQQPQEPVDVASLIRTACYSRVNQVRVAETRRGNLTVTFVTTNEQLAREAASIVSKLPELRPYEVRFEIQLTK